MTGATMAGGTAATGTALAGCNVDDVPVVFCGCSQVCACAKRRFDRAHVIIAEPGTDGYTVSSTPTIDLSDCYELDGSYSSEAKIVGLEIDGTIVCNPNTCAERALQDLGYGCEHEGDSGGPCGNGFLKRCDG